MRWQPLKSLQDIGIQFQFGHDILPLPKLRQVLWFHLESHAAGKPSGRSKTCYWIEYANGLIAAIELDDLDCQPDEIIPSLTEVEPTFPKAKGNGDLLRAIWLFPQNLQAAHLDDATIIPDQACLWGAIKATVSAMLCRHDLATPLSKRLEEVLEIRQSGITGDFYVPNDFDVVPSIEPPDEVLEFLSLTPNFQGRLSEDIITLFDEYAALLKARTHTIANYNTARCWTTIQRRNRFQAIRTFPWLFHELGLRTGGPDYYHLAASDSLDWELAISSAIDLGEPLIPLLTERYKIRKHTLRYAKNFLKYRYRVPDNIPPMLWLLDGINANKRPKNDMDMKTLHSVVDWIWNWQSEPDRVYVEAVAAALFSEGVSGFRRVISHWCPSHNPDNPFSDLKDFLSSYADQTERGPLSTELLDTLAKEWIKAAGVLSLFAASERWHNECWNRTIDIEAETWTPLTPESQPVENLVAHELSNTQLLIEEGRAMRHCIASYASLCASGNAFVFSLRDKDSGKRRSTIHIGMNEAGKFTVQEHRVFANRDADQECTDAAFQLIDAIPAFYPAYRERRHLACHSIEPSVAPMPAENQTAT